MTSTYDKTSTAGQIASDLASEIKGKTILTTGISPNGLGAAFVEAIAKHEPALLILAGRSTAKNDETAAAISSANPGVTVRTLQLDLSSLAAVRNAADEVNSWDDVPQIDVLVNNASVMATPYGTTADGFEMQLGTNHLGPFLFTNLIINKVLASKAPRVVVVSSDGHRLSPYRFGDPNWSNGETYNKWCAYGQSKTANMLTAVSLAAKLGSKKGLVAVSLHPGVIATNLGRDVDWSSDFSLGVADKAQGHKEGWKGFDWKTHEQGAATHVYAAFHPELKNHNGAYLIDGHVADPWVDTVKPWATDAVEAERVWAATEELLGEKFAY